MTTYEYLVRKRLEDDMSYDKSVSKQETSTSKTVKV